MKRVHIRLISFLLIVLSWLILNFMLVFSSSFSMQSSAYAFSRFAQTTPTATPTPILGPSPDAQLGFIGTLLAALIAGIFVIYQVRKNKKLQDDNMRMQRE